MAIDYRQSGIDYRQSNYSYQGAQSHAITAAITGTATVVADVQSIMIAGAITGTGTVTAAITEVAFVAGAITGTGTMNQPVLIRKVPQPDLEISVSNITGSSNAEERQHSLELLVGV